jgi:hypothetical protein
VNNTSIQAYLGSRCWEITISAHQVNLGIRGEFIRPENPLWNMLFVGRVRFYDTQGPDYHLGNDATCGYSEIHRHTRIRKSLTECAVIRQCGTLRHARYIGARMNRQAIIFMVGRLVDGGQRF